MIKKLKKKKSAPKHHIKNLHNVRNPNYRVFISDSYFKIDLQKEIKWHKQHLSKLHKFSKKPHLFYEKRHDTGIDDHKDKHFKEHVVDSIPFHKQILEHQEKRLSTIKEIMPLSKYKKLVKLTKEIGEVPEYFVFDKVNKEFFFIIEVMTTNKKRWMHAVKDLYEICDVVILK